MHIVALAFRNVGRNRRRSVLAAISVGLSLLLIVCGQAWIGGIMGSLVTNYTKSETGHIRIATKKFEAKYRFAPVTDNIENPDAIIAAICRDPAIAGRIGLITQRIAFGVLLNREGNSKTALALAVDPEKERRLLMLQKSILPGGRYLSGRREVILGNTIADRLGYHPGDTVKIVTTGSDWALHLKKHVIVGIFKTGVGTLDDGILQMSLQDGQDMLAMGHATQQILIMLRDYHQSDRTAAAIRAIVKDTTVSVLPWTRIGDYYQLTVTAQSIYNLIFIVVALLGAFIISNIMMMVVMERRREIGILKSMGMNRREILLLFLFEGMLMGLIGSAAGAVLGTGIVLTLHTTGIDIGPLVAGMKIPVETVIYPVFSVSGIVQGVVLGTAMAAFVSIFPSRQASRMNAVEAIKSV